jgi:nicotinamide-nucleotide amidase
MPGVPEALPGSVDGPSDAAGEGTDRAGDEPAVPDDLVRDVDPAPGRDVDPAPGRDADPAPGRDADPAPGDDLGRDADPTVAPQLVRALAERGWTVAVAESLTGGMVAAAIVDVPGASRVLRGGVVAYATDLKATLLGVDAALLTEHGAVDPRVAEQMAQGVRRRLGADVGLATTGVAGPGDQGGHPSGEVHVAVATPAGVRVESLRLGGDRAAVRAGARRAVLTLAVNLAGSATVEGEHPAAG